MMFLFSIVDTIKSLKGKNERYLGVAIETQDFPNGVNERKFRVKLLEKGKEHYQKTIFKFNIK